MSHKFFMDGDTLMVSMKCDPSTVATRPATDEEKTEYDERMEYLAAQDEQESDPADEPSDDPADGTPMPVKEPKTAKK